MPAMSSVAGASGYGRAQKPAAAPVSVGGSLYFEGTTADNLSIANDADLRFGTGDFTVEWFQYMETGNSYPRIFAIGTYPSTSIGCSIESGNQYLYAWISGANAITTTFSSNLNKWVHIAFCRSGTSFRCFIDGTQVGSTLSNSTNFSNTTAVLRIGNESSTAIGAAYKGYLTNFRWSKGIARYTSNFTKPAAPLTADANTQLLLLATTSGTATTDSSSAAKTVTNGGVSWNALSPF